MIHHQFLPKKGDKIGYDGFKRITGTKIHVAVDGNGLPVSILLNSANQHDSTKFIDVMESISEYLDEQMIKEIVTVMPTKVMMQNILESYKINNNTYSVPNLHNVIADIKVEHHPVKDNFYFLCKDCHKKYDDGNKTTKHKDLKSHTVSSKMLNTDILPQDGDQFTEQQLYQKFQVANSGGIRPTVKNKAIILINSFFSEYMGGYKDHVDEKEGFVYFIGAGEGNQDFVRNNKSILESQYNGYVLLYFEKHTRNNLVFRYQLKFNSWTHERQVNSKGQDRQVIVFKLKIIS